MKKILIDPGHGGKDPGAVSGGWREKEINLEAALYIGPRLVEHGFEVGFTRTYDVDVGDVYSRGQAAKGYDYFLSIHCNAGGGKGTEIFTNCKEQFASTESALRDTLAPIFGIRNIASRRYDTGEFISRPIDGKRFVSTVDAIDWYGVLRGCWSVGVSGNLLEMFFIDSESDRAKFDADRKAVYEAIVQALCEAFGIAYRAPETAAPPSLAPPVKPPAPDYKALYEKERDRADYFAGKLSVLAGEMSTR